MFHDIYVSISAATFTIWLITFLTWLRWLKNANGERPFIAITLITGICMTVLSGMFLFAALSRDPSGLSHRTLAVGYRIIAIVICLAFWRLRSVLAALALKEYVDDIRGGKSE